MKKLLYAIAMVSSLYLHSTDIQDSGEATGTGDADLTTQYVVMTRKKRQGGSDFRDSVLKQNNKFYCTYCPENTRHGFSTKFKAEEHIRKTHASPDKNVTKQVQCFCVDETGEHKEFSSNQALMKHFKKCHLNYMIDKGNPLPDPLDAEFNEATIKYPVISQPAPPLADLDADI